MSAELERHPGVVKVETEDDRPVIEQMRRRDLWNVAKAHGVDFPLGATKDEMVLVLNAAYEAGVDIYSPPKPKPQPQKGKGK